VRKLALLLTRILILKTLYRDRAKEFSTADLHGFTRIRFLEFKRMGASGHLFSPGSFGKRTYLQDAIVFAHCTFSKRTWREKVQRGALAHGLPG
jgi:hypothetical protein